MSKVSVDVEIQKHVSKEVGDPISKAFGGFFEEAQELKTEAMKIVVTDVAQKEEIKLARSMRLKVKSIRVETEKKRKAMKEGIVREGKAIDGVANVIKYLVTPIESHLQEQEDFVKRVLAEEKARMVAKRVDSLSEFCSPEFYDVGSMSEDEFASLLVSVIKAKEEKHEAIRVQDEHKKQEEARQKAILEENEKLKKEAEELRLKEEEEKEKLREELRIHKEEVAEAARIKEEEAESERMELEENFKALQKIINDEKEAKLQAERDVAKKMADELQDKKDEEARVVAESKKKDRLMELFSDKEKTLLWVTKLLEISKPEVSNDDILAKIEHICDSVIELHNEVV